VIKLRAIQVLCTKAQVRTFVQAIRLHFHADALPQPPCARPCRRHPSQHRYQRHCGFAGRQRPDGHAACFVLLLHSVCFLLLQVTCRQTSVPQDSGASDAALVERPHPLFDAHATCCGDVHLAEQGRERRRGRRLEVKMRGRCVEVLDADLAVCIRIHRLEALPQREAVEVQSSGELRGELGSQMVILGLSCITRSCGVHDVRRR
jgi:hypothetical protein